MKTWMVIKFVFDLAAFAVKLCALAFLVAVAYRVLWMLLSRA